MMPTPIPSPTPEQCAAFERVCLGYCAERPDLGLPAVEIARTYWARGPWGDCESFWVEEADGNEAEFRWDPSGPATWAAALDRLVEQERAQQQISAPDGTPVPAAEAA